MMPTRGRQVAVEDSWRVVDGENDSFDTSILPSTLFDDKDILIPHPNEQPSSAFNSQEQPALQSQPQSSFDSQDSIRPFAKHQADDHLILGEPFRPSIPSPSVSGSTRQPKFQAPVPEFRMPIVDIDAHRFNSAQKSKMAQPGSLRGTIDHYSGMRHRDHASKGSIPTERESIRHGVFHANRVHDAVTPHYSFLSFLPSISCGIIQWTATVIGLAFHYAKRPLALLLTVYLLCGAIIMTQNMLQKSISVSLSPLCRVPGVSLLSLPFCPDNSLGGKNSLGPLVDPIEFDELVNAQAKFEDVLEKTVDGASLPFEMKRSEISLRDLRTLVKHSDIQARDELVFEFDGFIDMARRSAAELQRFNTHIGSAVDAVIIINRWTSRYIDELAPLSDGRPPFPSALATWSEWIFSPFQPTEQVLSGEKVLRDKYVEHTSLVSERIGALIFEAQAILRLLVKAEDHLSLIYEVSSRSAATLSSRRREIGRAVWTLVGGNAGRLGSLARQLKLLAQVDKQRSRAVTQVGALLLELEAIQAEIGELRDRVAEPGVLRAAAAAATLPLAIHIETIDRGVERLEAARQRIRVAEDDRVREALARGGVRDQLIDKTAAP